MECNKVEAVRAKGIAEQKMHRGDFEGARIFLLKAQKLSPELEYISQMLRVCDVHCAGKNKIKGLEMDWYGIFQIEQFADESTIKKQYRKLALLLHPDKNKFAGAEAAFKLIGEANMILTDPTKRSKYDMKLRSMEVKACAPKPKSHDTSVNNKYGTTNKFPTASYSQFGASNPQQSTFWTFCSRCGNRYQYPRDVVNKFLPCVTCNFTFMAVDLGYQGVPTTNTSRQFTDGKTVRNQGPCNVASQGDGGKPASSCFVKSDPMCRASNAARVDSKTQEKVGGHVNVGNVKTGGGMNEDKPNECSKTRDKVNEYSNVRDGKEDVGMAKPTVTKPRTVETSRNANGKRGRKSDDELSESSMSSSEDSEDGEVVTGNTDNQSGQHAEVNGGHQVRRSSRKKQHVSYNENLSDDDDGFMGTAQDGSSNNNCLGGSKKENASLGESLPGEKMRTGQCKMKQEKADVTSENGAGSELSVKSDCADPEFGDFEKEKREKGFAAGQIWALYDTLDGMPRFYARVKQVLSNGSELKITWLEPKPDDEKEKDWCRAELPVSCGKFRNGSKVDSAEYLMISHPVDCKVGPGGGKQIYPRKGETWAIFKDWDINWGSNPENHQPPYRFDFVEILSDFDKKLGISVAYLSKVKGFVSVFQQTKRGYVNSFRISPGELYRFSHKIPSFKLSGKERLGVPEGSFELDSAALPSDLDNEGERSMPENTSGSNDSGKDRSKKGNDKPSEPAEKHQKQKNCLLTESDRPGLRDVSNKIDSFSKPVRFSC